MHRTTAPALSTIVCVTVLCVIPSLRAQESSSDEQVLTVDVDLVNVLFTVTDGDGRYVNDLTVEDFTVLEDGVPQQVMQFEAETDRPLLMGLVIDVSASVRDKLGFEQDAAREFFYRTLERDRDRAMLIAFDTAPRLLQDFPEDLSVAVDKLEAGGTSALYDAVWLAINSKMVQDERPGRSILIVISDGADTSSRMSLEDALEIAQRNDVSIYAISTNGTAGFGNAAQEQGERALESLTGETGGRAFAPLRIEELTRNFEEITEELRFQYALSYYSSNVERDGSYRGIEIVPSDNDYRVQARSGYYAPVGER
jgi:Ca-activated chloride channel family protein